MTASAEARGGRVRRKVARGGRLVGLLAAPFLALAAALAGLAFVILMPICGLASALQGLAEWAWAIAKDLARGHLRAPTTRT